MQYFIIFVVIAFLRNVVHGSSGLDDQSQVMDTNDSNIVDQVMVYMDDILNSYIDISNDIAPYYNTSDKITEYQTDFSRISNQISSEIVTKFLNVRDTNFMTVQSLSEWCGLSTGLLPTMKKFLGSSKPGVVALQKRFLKQLLDKDLMKTNINNNAIFRNFKEAFDKVSALNQQLLSDYSPNSDYYKRKVSLHSPISDNEARTQNLDRNSGEIHSHNQLNTSHSYANQQAFSPIVFPQAQQEKTGVSKSESAPPATKQFENELHRSHDQENTSHSYANQQAFSSIVFPRAQQEKTGVSKSESAPPATRHFENELHTRFTSIRQRISSIERQMNETMKNINGSKQKIIQTMDRINALKPQIEQLVTVNPDYTESIQKSMEKLLTDCIHH